MSEPDARVGVGVIGARSMVATRAVMPAIFASELTRLVAVSSLSGPVPEPWDHLAAGTYDDVLGHPDVEAVYIPLPNGMHREWVERAADAGKHVLCEKPIASTVADAEAMAAACDAAGVLLAEAWMTPFDARWRAALDVARSGGLGSVLDVDASFTFTIGADAHDNYRWSPEQGGGALLDVGIYCLGPIVELWGADPDTIDATALWNATGVDARTEATLSWIDGREARIRCSFVDPEEQRIEAIGDAASMIVDGDAHTGGHRATSFLVAGADGRVSTTAVEASDPYLGMVDAFARAVRGEEPWPRPMTQTLELLTLIERIASASR
ncbi:MAG TPA: Gfo/Idh/MocA family oxidoreductase [Ilumatobacteraceae bacterium]|nr:Gfo/Idh/MocA family oxidoreductase [Ilumatobacteraceae bacterium]